jgi:hypothetical protein
VRPIYRTGVPLPSKCCTLYIFSTNISTEYFKHAANFPFFSSKFRLFHNAKFWFLYYSHFTYRVCQDLNVKFKICKSVHHRAIQLNHQPNIKIFQFIILTFVYGSTCFGHYYSYHPSSGAHNICNYSIW